LLLEQKLCYSHSDGERHVLFAANSSGMGLGAEQTD